MVFEGFLHVIYADKMEDLNLRFLIKSLIHLEFISSFAPLIQDIFL